MLFISGQEIFLIFLAVLVLFGANKIPEFARGLGKGLKEFKKAASDIKKEMEDYSNEASKEINDIKKDIDKTIDDDLKG